MPFWQKSTFAPLFRTVSTIRFSIPSSSLRKAWSWVGSVISIFASISVFLTSRAASTKAIFPSFTSFGMPGWTRSLSTMIPSTSSVSAIDPPCFLTIWMLSSSTKCVPSARCSATVVTPLTEMSASNSLCPLADFEDLPRLVRRLAVARGDYGLMNVLFDQIFRLLEQLTREDDRRGRAVAGLLVLGLRDLDEHLGRRVLDVNLLQDRHAIVRDHDVPEAVDQHLVHPAGPEGRADRVRNGLRRGDVVELRSLAALAASPFLQNQNRRSCWHHVNLSEYGIRRHAYVETSI